MRTKVVAKAVITNPEGNVLLLRRSQTDDRRPGEWDFPGGGIEAEEEFVAGILREIQEEAGLHIERDKIHLVYAATQPWEKTDESVTRLLFAVRLDSGDIQLSFEHDNFKWVDIETALEEFPHFFYATGLRYARDHGLLG